MPEGAPTLLPVHGFVLAGGKSSRMGEDKALLLFRGRPMVEIAVEKLSGFCAEVSIAGNREDLREFAPVVRETRVDAGPAAGIEAGLKAAGQAWALFVPVDVPLVPGELLRRWAEAVLAKGPSGCVVSWLVLHGKDQPAFCLLHRKVTPLVARAVDQGERRIRNLLWAAEAEGGGWVWACEAADPAGDLLNAEAPLSHLTYWFSNVNTPDELLDAEAGIGLDAGIRR